MTIRTWKIAGVLALGTVLAGSQHLYATGSTLNYPVDATLSSPALNFHLDDTYGTLTVSGPLAGGAGSWPNPYGFTFSGDPQLIWFPALAAFRVGAFSGYLSDGTVGQYSAAFGYDTTAEGEYAFAAGRNTDASNTATVAMGYNSQATSMGAVALGYGATASGMFSMAVGDSTASGGGAIALGDTVTANGFDSMATGYSTTASGVGAVAMGLGTTANIDGSTALGMSTVAHGEYSTATGLRTSTSSFASFVAGFGNIGTQEGGGTPNPTSYDSTDPIFEIGNGTPMYVGPFGPSSDNYLPATQSDAVVVYRDGTMTVQGPITVTVAGGDIPMYAP